MRNKFFRELKYGMIGLVLLTSCNKYLEKDPDNRAQLTTPEKVEQLLGTAYPQANYVPFTETSTDNVGDLGAGDIGAADLNIANADAYFFRDTKSINEDTPEFYWFACYHAIAACNEALETIRLEGDPGTYSAQKGEALVARAYAHFMLVNIFSKFYDASSAATDPGIPYVTEPEKNFIKQYTRGTVASVYDLVEKDLLEGLPLLNDNLYKVPKYHFNKSAANAFASRFYLYKADYAKVIQYSLASIPASGFSNALRPWNSTYSVLGVNDIPALYAKATENANLLLTETRSYWARTYALARYAVTPIVANQLLRTVPVADGSWAFPIVYYIEGHNVVPKINEYFVRISVNADIGDGYVMVPLFTAEEVLFNLAEAYTYSGQFDQALSLLNTYLSTRVRQYNPSANNLTTDKLTAFYGTNNTGYGLISTILAYRRSEFVHEGLRWFDILRYKITVIHDGTLIQDGDPRRVFQIPPSVKQSGIEQNPR